MTLFLACRPERLHQQQKEGIPRQLGSGRGIIKCEVGLFHNRPHRREEWRWVEIRCLVLVEEIVVEKVISEQTDGKYVDQEAQQTPPHHRDELSALGRLVSHVNGEHLVDVKTALGYRLLVALLEQLRKESGAWQFAVIVIVFNPPIF